MAHANPIQIQKYLKGVDYPARRAQLIENAKNMGADESVCASLEQLPDDEFQTPAEVSQAFKGPSSDDVQSEDEQSADASGAVHEGAEPGAGEFLVQVMEDSLAEMEICMLALDRSARDEVKAFAQGMLDEHGKFGQQIEKMASEMQVAFPKKVRPEHAGLIREMTRLKGEQFDRRFVEQNLRYHENDLKVFEHYARQTDGGAVRKLAEAGVKLFKKHLDMVRQLEETLRS
jgi:predicted outer membrane protein